MAVRNGFVTDITDFANVNGALSAGDTFPEELLRSFPRVLARIDQVWGTPACEKYLDELQFSDRSGREGFPDSALVELAQIKGLHRARYPALNGESHDPFATVFQPDVDLLTKRRAANSRKGRDPAPGKPISVAPLDVAEPTATMGTAEAEAKANWPMMTTEAQLRECLASDLYGKKLRDHRRLGEILVSVGAAPQAAVDAAVEVQGRQGRHGSRRESIGKLLTEAGAIKAQDLVWALCMQGGVPIIDLARVRPAGDVLRRVAPELMREKNFLPIMATGKTLAVVTADPFSTDGLNYVGHAAGMVIRPFAGDGERLAKLIQGDGQGGNMKQVEDEFKALASRAMESFDRDLAVSGAEDAVRTQDSMNENDATVIGLVNKFINDSVQLGASDIHIEGSAYESSCIRIRRDGDMQPYSDFSRDYHRAVVSRIKIMADLDISERRRPQDGKISFKTNKGQRIDLRVAVIPTLRGIENVTIRILQQGDPLPLAQIGMAAHVLERFRRDMFMPFGLILVCGPTGSGKTTTLHSALHELNTPERKIWTAEDPVEIVQRNISQVQVNARIGCDFSHVLRAFLRADPDVIMIGEMRDQETAKIAVEASMTGHLVLSTLHTNSAAETVARLLDLGIDPFNFSDALLMILAQRLTRRLCPDCVRLEEPTADELREMAIEYHASETQKTVSTGDRERIITRWVKEIGGGRALRVGRPVGCEACWGSGYRGRVGVHELLVSSPELRSLVRNRANAHDIQSTAISQGMRTLKQDGIEKVLQGLTDMSQVRTACVWAGN